MKKKFKKVVIVVVLVAGIFSSAKLMSCYKIDPTLPGIVITIQR